MKLNHENIKEVKNKLIYPSELFINGKHQKSISHAKLSALIRVSALKRGQ